MSRGLQQTIFVVHSSQNRRRLDAVPFEEVMSGRLRPSERRWRFWQVGAQAGMGTPAMIMRDPFGEDLSEVALAERISQSRLSILKSPFLLRPERRAPRRRMANTRRPGHRLLPQRPASRRTPIRGLGILDTLAPSPPLNRAATTSVC